MKKTAKTLSILLALVTVTCLATSAFAADYTASTTGTWTGVSKDAQDLVYLSADGSDEDELPDLLTGYYVSNEDDLTWANRNVPTWDESYGKGFYVHSASKIWGLTKGKTDQSDYGTDEIGAYRLKDNVKYYYDYMYLGNIVGAGSSRVEHGIGVKPSPKGDAQENYVMFNVDGYNHFYSIVGLTGSGFNRAGTNIPADGDDLTKKTGNNTTIFEVWGSTNAISDTDTESKANDSSFVLLAASGEIGAQQTGEFNIDISGYKTLKLVAKVGSNGVNAGTDCLWGNAAVYNLGEVPPTEATEPETEPSTEPETEPETQAPTKAPAATEAPADDGNAEPSSPVGIIIGIVAAVVVIAAVVVVIIKKKKSA